MTAVGSRGISVRRAAPLLAKVQPIEGESLMSLIARAAEANVFPNMADLLGHAGVKGFTSFAPFTAMDKAPELAALLGVELRDILLRLHPRLDAVPDKSVDWGGVKMERRFIEARMRRFAPASLRASPHHRLAWTNRALSFCPESFEVLLCDCPHCHRQLGWTKTWGLTRCEHCRGSLLNADTTFVPEPLQGKLLVAADLISAVPPIREAALARLSPPFSSWNPGDVFAAIVELGMAWLYPSEASGSPMSKALAVGRLGLIPAEALAAGAGMALDWPAAYAELVERICASRGSQARGITPRRLGLLSRHFDQRRPLNPLRALLREEIGSIHIRGARLRLEGRFLQPPSKASKTLTLNEAQVRLKITKAVLGRLVPNSRCCISGKLGRGGGVLLDARKATATAKLYHASILPVEAAALLGMPAYCLGALADVDLIEPPIRDPDVLLLARSKQMFLRSTINGLIEEFDDLQSSGGGWEPLYRSLARQFAPGVWARVILALVSGELHQSVLDLPRPVLDRILVDPDEVEAFIADLGPQPIPENVNVTAAATGLLFGMSPKCVIELIGAKLLKAQPCGRGWSIRLEDIQAFHHQYILSPEIKQRYGVPRGANNTHLIISDGAVFNLRHLTVWEREPIEDWL